MTAYYNEKDPFAAAWLRELIKEGLIAPGDVGERSIEDVIPTDLTLYTQCHFFAGIGGWSYALRLAGWPDDKPVWTGSPPCQPFSEAGKREGFDDQRHLWPSFHWLISQCRPGIIFGEEVASPLGLQWWDIVASDMEALSYAVAAVDIPAASVKTFHRRQRLYWVAYSKSERVRKVSTGQRRSRKTSTDVSGGGRFGVALGDTSGTGLERRKSEQGDIGEEQQAVERTGDSGVAYTNRDRGHDRWGIVERGNEKGARGEAKERGAYLDETKGLCPTNKVGSFWSDAEWILCADGKWRAIKPGIFPLANGVPNRVGTLRGAGNAIVPQLGAEFIKACMEVINE